MGLLAKTGNTGRHIANWGIVCGRKISIYKFVYRFTPRQTNLNDFSREVRNGQVEGSYQHHIN